MASGVGLSGPTPFFDGFPVKNSDFLLINRTKVAIIAETRETEVILLPGIKYLTRVVRGMSFGKMNNLLNVVKQKSGHSKLRTACDMVICGFKYGAGYYDYTAFGFYDMNGKQRDTYVTRVRNKKICEIMNKPGFGILFDDKLQFNAKFEKFLHRKWLDASKATAADIEDFLRDQTYIFAKPNRGVDGHGIEKLVVADFPAPEAFLDYVKSKNLLVLEQELIQHPDMARPHPQSVNTMRIVTDRVGDTVHLAYITLKFGRGDSFCDNSGQNGVMVRVDPKSGKIVSDATDDYYNIFDKHPDTGIVFKGYQVPMVHEAVALAKEAAMVVPEIGHVGWDVAVTPDGPALIEGNDYPGSDMGQLAPHYPEKHGLWPFYKSILNLK